MKQWIYFPIGIALILLCSPLKAQTTYSSSGKPVEEALAKGFDPQRIIFGGGFHFGMGSGYLRLGVSPVLGYRITKNFSAGIGLRYEYLSIKEASYTIDSVTYLVEPFDLKTHGFAFSVWARHIVWNHIFLHVEPELINQETFHKVNNFRIDRERKWIPCLLVGGGIRQPISERSSVVLSLLYDLLQEDESPYRNNLEFRVGFLVGF